MKCVHKRVQRPLYNVEHPQSCGGYNLHKSVLVSPQYLPKDPSVNQACAIIIQGGGSCGPRGIMKTRVKVHNPNTTYKMSHVSKKTII